MNESDVLTEIKVSLGKIETTLENVLHRFRNIEQANQAFVPRREIEKENTQLAARVSRLETILWATWGAGGGVVTLFGRKTGLF